MSTSQQNVSQVPTQSSKLETSLPEQKTPETAELLRPENESGLSSVMRTQIQNMVKVQFQNKFGREPSSEELESFSSAVMGQFFDSSPPVPATDEDDNTTDPDYTPEDDEDQGSDEADEEEEMAQLVNETETEEKSDTLEATDDKNDAQFKEEMEAALANVRLMAASQRTKLLEAAKKQYEAETGEVADEKSLSEAFNLLKDKLYPDGTEDQPQDEEEEEDQDAAEAESKEQPADADAEEDDEAEAEAIEAEMEDEDVEAEVALSEEELRSEIELAFEAVRQRGQMDGRRLAALVSDTFFEINGREADSSDISAVFSRIQTKLADEAAEELIYDDDEHIGEPVDERTINEQVDDIVSQLPQSPGELDSEKRKELVAYAQTVVTRDMASKARQQFEKITERPPTAEEFDDLMITLATTAFVDADFEGSDTNDEDYDPEAFTEQLTIERDAQIDAEECATVDKADAFDVLGAYDSSRINVSQSVAFYSPLRNGKSQDTYLEKAAARFGKTHSRAATEAEKESLAKFLSTSDFAVLDNRVQPPSPPRRKPVAFFSPVRAKKSAKADYNELSDTLMKRAIKHFENIHKRGPNEEETQQLGKFLTTDGLSYEWSDDENDSDYDPTKDESCDVVDDNALTEQFDASYVKEDMDAKPETEEKSSPVEPNDENVSAANNQ